MRTYGAVIETADDGTRAEAQPVVVELRNARTGQLQRVAIDEFSGGHLLHLAVAGCVYNDLYREAAARGITLTHVSVSADGGFAGEPCTSTGVDCRIRLEGDASSADLEDLVAHVEQIAEVPSALRRGAPVRLQASEVVSSRG